ncbi:MAG: putative multiheme cytochrome c [Candidatus Syntrophoarchaeum sp. GoM_oil]|nr:MAG: putative multiheme cytochrome c [Candidatus Syntrophoarchaeum sp. GoM_oil]
MVAVLAIGIFALPNTAALFSGQHSWYDLGAGGNDVPCEKCHGDIADEMNSMPAGVGAPHRTYPCAHCHRISGFGENDGNGMTYASGNGNGSTPGKEAHAASTVECMDCHDLNYMWGRPPLPPSDHHKDNPDYQVAPLGEGGGGPYPGCGFGPGDYGPYHCHAPPRQQDNIAQIRTGGFGLTDFDNTGAYYYWKTWPEDTGNHSAHRKFVLDAMNETLMDGANEACIAYHTHVGINITWTKNVVLEFTASEDENGNWTIPDFSAAGSNVTESAWENEWVNP